MQCSSEMSADLRLLGRMTFGARFASSKATDRDDAGGERKVAEEKAVAGFGAP